MSEFDQVPFGAEDFANNSEPRCPCVLLLDTSHSMQGRRINALNDGIVAFKDALSGDSLAMKRVELAVVTFGPVTVQTDFMTPDAFYPTPYTTSGDTPMGAAIERALDMIRERKNTYRANGISYYRPWIFLITDGSPTDSIVRASELVREGETTKAHIFFSVGVEGADMKMLSKISMAEPINLKGLMFNEMFAWLSSSLSSVSHSQVGDEVPLANPTAGPRGWASV